MSTQNGTLSALESAVAQELLHSTEMAQLAYNWSDGTPRVVPIWFTWNGSALVLGSPPNSPKVDALRRDPEVAITINTTGWPYRVLLLRGRAEVEVVEGVVPEYAASAQRYFGAEQGQGWVNQVGQMFSQMARIVVRPTWAKTLDFESRFPQAIESAMAGS